MECVLDHESCLLHALFLMRVLINPPFCGESIIYMVKQHACLAVYRFTATECPCIKRRLRRLDELNY
jgi:hypothetical protein